MKKILFTLFAIFSTALVANAQTPNAMRVVFNDGTATIFTLTDIEQVTFLESVETELWAGSKDVGWSDAMSELAYGNYDWSAVLSGQTLYVTYTIDGDSEWPSFKLGVGNGWDDLSDTSAFSVSEDGTVSYTLTQADIDALTSNDGLVIYGDGVTITEVTLK